MLQNTAQGKNQPKYCLTLHQYEHIEMQRQYVAQYPKSQ